MNKHLEVLPLGGLGEFGMNCTALRYEGHMILIDAGIAFPSSHLGTNLGVDVIVPDVSFLEENHRELKAILLTHGHEDHAGAISYITQQLQVPIYGSRLTLGLVTERLKERRLDNATQLRPIQSRQRLDLAPFHIEPLRVTHSFPDAFSFAITTPVGCIIWTGDFKFDLTPIDRKLSEVPRLSEYGEKGVLALFSDSTNSAYPGLSPSESSVVNTLRALFRETEGKVLVSCFASSIHRIQIVLDLALELRRKVVLLGRSIVSNVRVATQLGYLRVPPEGLLIPATDVQRLDPSQVVILATGSQGEPMSALSRLAVNEFTGVEVRPGDAVILSTRVIPGNEKLISNMINHFFRRGVHVHDSRSSPVHASGHGYSDDLKLMINLTRPKFFVPIHGEFKQLRTHAWLAREQGIPEENIHLIENGECLKISPSSARKDGKITVGRRFIDEGILEEVQDVVLRDRRYLSEDGFLVIVLRMDRFSGELIGDVELISRGFVQMDTSDDLLVATREHIVRVVSETPVGEKQDEELFKEVLRRKLRRFLRKRTGKRPMILPVTLEI